MQTSAYGSAAKSSLDAFRYVIRDGGVAMLYRGFGITIMREVRFLSIRFVGYHDKTSLFLS